MSTTSSTEAGNAPCTVFDVSRTRPWDERDAFISWLRGEFAAANAIIDALCQHLQAISSSPTEYDAVLSCVHQRRYNWNPVLHMQQYYSVSEVLFSLQQLAYQKQQQQVGLDGTEEASSQEKPGGGVPEESKAAVVELNAVVTNGSTTGVAISQVATRSVDAFEEVDGQQVNLLEGLAMHEGVFDAKEASRIAALAGESHASKKKNKSGGEKRCSKVKAKEVIHFGTIPSDIVAASAAQQSSSSSCEKAKEKPASSPEKVQEKTPSASPEERAEPMPAFLESIIDRLVTSQVVPASKRPDSCSISFLEAGDYMPPHKHNNFEQPLFILSLGSQSELTFGRNLKLKDAEQEAPKYKLVLPVGSVLVLEGNSAEMVQCAVSPTQSTRTLITFGKMAKRFSKPAAAAVTTPVSPTRSSTVTSFVPARIQKSPPAPLLVPVRAPAPVLQSQPMIVASIGPYSPAVAVAWSTPATRVSSPGTGVFLPAKAASFVYNSSPHQHMNGSHRRLAAAAAAAVNGRHFENATTATNGSHVMAEKEVAA